MISRNKKGLSRAAAILALGSMLALGISAPKVPAEAEPEKRQFPKDIIPVLPIAGLPYVPPSTPSILPPIPPPPPPPNGDGGGGGGDYPPIR